MFKMKKAISLLASAVMIMCLGSGVFAGDGIEPYADGITTYAQMNWSYVFRSPNKYTYISTYYSQNHVGIDLAAPAGTPIYSTTSGTVIKADFNSSMGNNVVLRTNSSDSFGYLTTRNMHMLNTPSVTVGQSVNANTVIGSVGDTGTSGGNHLHFDVNNMGSWDGDTLRSNFSRTVNPTWLFPSIGFTMSNSIQIPSTEGAYAYENDFYSIDTPLIKLIGESEFQTFIDAYEGTGEFNIINFIHDFNITKADFENAYATAAVPLHNADVVYSNDADRINAFYNL